MQPAAVLPGRAGENHRVRQPPCAAHVGRCGSGVVAEAERVGGGGDFSPNSRLNGLRLRIVRAKMTKWVSFSMHEAFAWEFLELSAANRNKLFRASRYSRERGCSMASCAQGLIE